MPCHQRPAATIIRLIAITAALVVAVVGFQPVASAQDDGVNAPIEARLCGEPGEVTVRLYRLFFGRVPDPAGLAYWSDIYTQTGSVIDVAFWMAQGAEYRNQWDGVDDEGYVEGLLYRNLLGRPSEAAGKSFWLKNLREDGVARSELAVYWVVQPELTGRHPVTEPAQCSLADRVKDIPGGRAVEFDYLTTDLRASSRRCGIVSINANWVHRDGNPAFSEHIGFANINGQNVPSRNNVGDDNSRGIFGSRRIGEGGEVGDFNAKFDDAVGFINVHSSLVQKGNSKLQLHANYWDTNRTDLPFAGNEQGWDWAVGGISMVVNNDYNVVTAGQDYTFNTTRHSFVAFRAPSTIMLGATTSMTADQMVRWLQGQGYTDIMKMDGGGSVEMNESGRVTVAGTSRPLPVWLGVGC